MAKDRPSWQDTVKQAARTTPANMDKPTLAEPTAASHGRKGLEPHQKWGEGLPHTEGNHVLNAMSADGPKHPRGR